MRVTVQDEIQIRNSKFETRARFLFFASFLFGFRISDFDQFNLNRYR